MATNNASEIKRLKDLEKQVEKSLKQSKTAYSSGANPSASDIETQLKLLRTKRERESLEQTDLRDRIYGPQGTEIPDRERDEGAISRGLHALSAPMYGIAGGVEALLGKGTKTGVANIPANIKERGDFGSLLRQFGAPGSVAMPIGLALDIALDPVNWATVGTAALIPRIAKGTVKAGLTGAKVAAKSGVLSKAETIGRFIPGVRKAAAEEVPGKIGTAYKSISAAAKKGRTDFREIAGKGTLMEELDKRALRKLPSERIKESLTPEGKMARFYDAFSDKKPEWFANQKKADKRLWSSTKEMQKELGIDISHGSGTELVITNIDDANTALLRTTDKANKTGSTLFDEGAEVALYDGKRTRVAERAGQIDGDVLAGRLTAEVEFEKESQTLLRSVVNEADDAIKNLGDTEIVAYDKLMAKVKNSPVANKMLNAYEVFIGMFKLAKVTGNPSAYMNATLGNPTMFGMAGGNIFDPGYIKNVYRAWSFLRGKGGKSGNKLIEGLMNDIGLKGENRWITFMDKYPGLFKNTFGFDPSIFIATEKSQQKILSEAIKEITKDGKKLYESDIIEAKQAMDRSLNQIKNKMFKERTSTDLILKAKDGEILPGLIGVDIYQGAFKKFINGLQESESPLQKKIVAVLTKPMDSYQRIDQSYKLGTALHLSQNGISEQELTLLSKVIRIPAKDVQEISGGLYRLSPERAVEASHEIYMNYAAMPGAVKVLRSAPLFGAPFASFMYGMGTKAGKTLMYNPAFYNKVNSIMGEVQGDKSPIEKTALQEPYYQWFNKPGMMKLPFFKDNPVYMNVANMLPYYTMNMFQPSERKFTSKASGIAASWFDKLPIFKTPEAQLMFDYFIQPVILRESQPRGMFDQPLWYRDATGLEKARTIIRDSVGTVVPPVIGFAGLVTPESIADYLPSFRWQQIARAKAGKTAQGVKTNEPAVQKTLRSVLSTFGVPLHELKLRNTEQQNTK